MTRIISFTLLLAAVLVPTSASAQNKALRIHRTEHNGGNANNGIT